MAGILDTVLATAFPATPADLARIIGPRQPRGSKGAWGRRIIKTERWNGRIWELHATKGWRSYRDPDSAEQIGARGR